MPTPEPRFEVPPEYADVYERAYRRAYEERPGPLVDTADATTTAARSGLGIPRQRSGRGRGGVSPRSTSVHRGVRSRRPSVILASGFTLALLALLLAAFTLGRVTASGPVASGPTWVPDVASSSGPSDVGSAEPARVRDVATTCTALSSPDAQGRTAAFEVQNVLDDNPATAWRCDGLAVGQQLTFTLSPGTRVVQVGIVPGLARDDPSTGADDYRLNNRITRVSWVFGNGTVIDQRLGDDASDRSLRTLTVPVTTTSQVRLKILGVSRGEQNATTISTVQILAAR